MSRRRHFILIATALMLLTVQPAIAGVILVYHHVSEQTPPSTSVTPKRFAAHLDYLESNDFRVWPLARLLEAGINGTEKVPPKVVAITFDDAYASVYDTAWPMLRARGWPFAVFVSTDAIDAGHAPYMRWDELRELHGGGVTIGNHSASHAHLIARRPGEDLSAWQARVRADVEKARRRIEEELGTTADLFAYPYGEESKALADIIGQLHRFALVQRSGAVGERTNRLAVPRFPMATGFDSLDRFSLAVNARALPVLSEHALPSGDGVRGPVQRLNLELAEGEYRPAQLGCFASSGQPLQIDLIPGPPHQLAVFVNAAGSTGRNKINCTAPATDGSGDFFWHSFQWVQDAVRD